MIFSKNGKIMDVDIQYVSPGTRIRFFVIKPAAKIPLPRAVT